jgi:hypothetical protein
MPMSEQTMTTNTATSATEPGETASPARCACGEVLPPPRPTVSQRVVCSPRCQRHRDHVLRRVAVRRRWIAGWHAEAEHYTPEQIADEVRMLEQDIADLLATLQPTAVEQVQPTKHLPTDSNAQTAEDAR